MVGKEFQGLALTWTSLLEDKKVGHYRQLHFSCMLPKETRKCSSLLGVRNRTLCNYNVAAGCHILYLLAGVADCDLEYYYDHQGKEILRYFCLE